MTKATFFYRSYQVLLTCYYTQVSYTGFWEPLVFHDVIDAIKCPSGQSLRNVVEGFIQDGTSHNAVEQ